MFASGRYFAGMGAFDSCVKISNAHFEKRATWPIYIRVEGRRYRKMSPVEEPHTSTENRSQELEE